MERAADLLAHRGLTVRDVARRVGYRQPAQFAKAFRRHHGIAPSDSVGAKFAGAQVQVQCYTTGQSVNAAPYGACGPRRAKTIDSAMPARSSA